MPDDFSQQLVEYSKRMAQESGAHWEYLQGKVRKEKLVDDLARQRKHPDGLLAVLCCLETCRCIHTGNAFGIFGLTVSNDDHLAVTNWPTWMLGASRQLR